MLIWQNPRSGTKHEVSLWDTKFLGYRHLTLCGITVSMNHSLYEGDDVNCAECLSPLMKPVEERKS